MELGFDTIGNATLIAYDRAPVLVTDPWTKGTAYFGSWGLSHEIPAEQEAAIKAAPFAWISHGHPDHLNGDSLEVLRGKTVLLANHVGARIKTQLEERGLRVRVLEDRTWVSLSDRIHVLSVADYNQDSVLLVDVGGTLAVDLNDARDRGWGRFVREEIKRFDTSVMLALTGYNDTDMIHFYDEGGRQILPPRGGPVGQSIALLTSLYGTTHFIPFSSHHRYQRLDSVWASAYTTHLEDYRLGFESKTCELLPAFARFDASTRTASPISPRESDAVVHSPADFGDDWSEPLSREDADRVERYFRSIEHLADFLSFVNVRVGGQDHVTSLRREKFDRGITFEVPRGSLMTAIEYEIWDDLLIGNFMRTTLHGTWPAAGLGVDFTPYVAKYGDNGRAKTREQLERYFEAYRKRSAFDFLRHRLEERAKHVVRATLRPESLPYRVAKKIYWSVKK
jgi:hypothetical protein